MHFEPLSESLGDMLLIEVRPPCRSELGRTNVKTVATHQSWTALPAPSRCRVQPVPLFSTLHSTPRNLAPIPRLSSPRRRGCRTLAMMSRFARGYVCPTWQRSRPALR